MRVAENNRLKSTIQKAVRKDLEAHLAWLDKRIKGVENQLDKLVAANLHWKANDELLRSIPGIDAQTAPVAARPVAQTRPTRPPPARILVGLALDELRQQPPPGLTRIVGDRATSARRCTWPHWPPYATAPAPARFFARLRAQGKPGKVAMTALARKILCIANAVIRDQTPWRHSIVATS